MSEYTWNTGGMVLTGQIRSSSRKTWRKSCSSDTLYTINPTRNGLGAKPCLHGDRPATNSTRHGTANFVIET